MARSKSWFALDVEFMHSKTAKRLLDEYDFAGPVVWVAFLGACATNRDRGTFTYHNESHGWVKLGLDYPITPQFTLDEFFRTTGKMRQTRSRRDGTLRIVTCSHWDDWQNAFRREKEADRIARKRAQNSATESHDEATDSNENQPTVQNSNSTFTYTGTEQHAGTASADISRTRATKDLLKILNDADEGTRIVVRSLIDSKRLSEGDIIAAREAALGPGVRSRTAVAVAELKKRGDRRAA